MKSLKWARRVDSINAHSTCFAVGTAGDSHVIDEVISDVSRAEFDTRTVAIYLAMGRFAERVL